MTLSFSGGTVLCFSHEALRAAHLSPEQLSREELLTLVRAELARQHRPVPDALEVRAVFSQHNILVFTYPILSKTIYETNLDRIFS